jgi:hypothetical protein
MKFLPAPPFYLATIVIPAKAGIQHPSIGGYSVVKVRFEDCNLIQFSDFVVHPLPVHLLDAALGL